jgi:hypothetical protein
VKQRGRPIRGAVAGLFFGIFLSLDLVLLGVFALDADVLALFPVLGLIAGVALGVMAPLHRRGTGSEEGPTAEPESAPVKELEPIGPPLPDSAYRRRSEA